jgi:hypothetical protein
VTDVRRGRRWHVLLPVGLSAGVAYGGVQEAAHSLLSHDPWNWTDMAASGGIWAILWPPAWLLGQKVARRGINRGWISQTPARRRRDRERELVQPAIEAGILPPHSDPEQWRPALRAQAREINGLRWLTGVGLTGSAGLIGSAAVANESPWGIWALAILVGAEGVVVFPLQRRRLRVIRRLLTQLR